MNCNDHKNLGQLNIYKKRKHNEDHNKDCKGVPLDGVVCYGGNGVTEREHLYHCVMWCVVEVTVTT